MARLTLKTHFPFLLKNSYIWSHLQLRSWFCRQRIFTSSHSSWFYFQTIVSNCLFLSTQNSTTPVPTAMASDSERTATSSPEWPPRVPSRPTIPSPHSSQRQKSIRSLSPPPRRLCTAQRITQLSGKALWWHTSRRLCPPWPLSATLPRPRLPVSCPSLALAVPQAQSSLLSPSLAASCPSFRPQRSVPSSECPLWLPFL